MAEMKISEVVEKVWQVLEHDGPASATFEQVVMATINVLKDNWFVTVTPAAGTPARDAEGGDDAHGA